MSTDEPPVEGGPQRRSAPPVALIAGPTASGKSDLAVRLALARRERGLASVVINADSAQVYRDLHVLSARPSEAEMQDVPHRLCGEWDGAAPCSAADWAAAARREIAAAHAAGALPILVGGTGLYQRTLIEGIAPVPRIDPDVREVVRAMPTADAHAALQREDPQRAAKLHPNDSLRIARALEVIRSTGHPLSYWQQVNTNGIQNTVALYPLLLLPDLGAIRERGDRRFVGMLDGGAAEEVQALLARGLSVDLPVMRAIGVREVAGWINGQWSREEAIERGQRATWQYVRRQYTWFRRQTPEWWPRSTEFDNNPSAIFASLLQD
jgi:tRNA dimethylallyltransferase